MRLCTRSQAKNGKVEWLNRENEQITIMHETIYGISNEAAQSTQEDDQNLEDA